MQAARRTTFHNTAVQQDGGQVPRRKPNLQEPHIREVLLSDIEIIRRLRVLGEPATLFGETGEMRYGRLHAAEHDLHVDDETAGGQQANLHLEIQREDKSRPKRAKGDRDRDDEAAQDDNDAAAIDTAQQRLMQAFADAAETVAEDQLAVEDRVAKWLRRWLNDWEIDMAARPEEVCATPEGMVLLCCWHPQFCFVLLQDN